ncbi:MAG TPA: tetratricopeptide repeat protein, partial [Ignavibacteriales bacterium]|nr:tetratricopeptide repeat protein [Ignavibacteriales bacterium]
NKGCYLFDLKKYDEALAEFEEIIQINPKYYRARYNAGLIYEAKKDYEKAIENYQAFADNAPLSQAGRIIQIKDKINSLKSN